MYILSVLFALLAAAGALALLWLLFGRLVAPVGSGPLLAVLPARGDGRTLEQDVRGLYWLAAGQLIHCRIVIVDLGLDPEGLAAARALLRRRPEVTLAGPEDLARQLEF